MAKKQAANKQRSGSRRQAAARPTTSNEGLNASEAAVITFKVALSGNKKIWRSIALERRQTLDDLHEAIFDAFDRYDEHLYSFFFPFPGTKLERWPRNATEYTSPFGCEDPGPFRDTPLLNAEKATLESLDLSKGQTFLYLFDFGDEWWHIVTVEGFQPKDGRVKYPKVVDKRGNSPPQYEFDDDDF